MSEWKRKLPLILVVGGVLVFACMVVYGVAMLSIQNNVTVVSVADVDAMPVLIEWGEVAQGEVKTADVLLQNSGDSSSGPLTIVCPTFAFGTMTCLDGTTVTVAGHSSETLTFQLSVNADAVPGDFNDFGVITISE